MLSRDSVHVWRVRLDAGSSGSALGVTSWRDVLSVEEQRRADAFRGEEHRRDYIQAHVALRCVLGNCLGIAPASVRFTAGSTSGTGIDGKVSGSIKPALMRAGNQLEQLDMRFNLSHTRGAALIGVGVGLELGIDIEWHRPMDDLDAIARSVMSNTETEQWLLLKPEVRTRAFYHLWTRKEAYLKAIGLGLYRNLQDVTVPVSPDYLDDAPGRVYLVQDRAGAGKWSVRDVPVREGYSASLCCEGKQVPRIVVQEFDLDNFAQGA
jgi:4'-phosphopantetheinyl transferase